MTERDQSTGRHVHEGTDAVRDFDSLQMRWPNFVFDYESEIEESVNDSVSAIDQLITAIGGEALQEAGVWTILVGRTPSYSLGMFTFGIDRTLAQNLLYLCNQLGIPVPPAYAGGSADATAVIRRPEKPLNGTTPGRSGTMIIRQTEIASDEFTEVDPRHKAVVELDLNSWDAECMIASVSENGCVVRTFRRRDAGPFTVQGNDAVLTFRFEDQPPLTIPVHIKEVQLFKRANSFHLEFRQLTPDQRETIRAYFEKLKVPLPPPPTFAQTMDIMRSHALAWMKKEIGRVHPVRVAATATAGVAALALAGAVIAYKTSNERAEPVPASQIPLAIIDDCRVRFAEAGEHKRYFVRCDATVHEGTRAKLVWTKEQPKEAGKLAADIVFPRGERVCKTTNPQTITPGVSQDLADVPFTCVAPPQE